MFNRFRTSRDEEPDVEALENIFQKINDVISSRFHSKKFGLLVVDSKKIKIYETSFNSSKCIFSISHRSNFFEIGSTLKKLGLHECEDSLIPARFQKDYLYDKIWIFEITSKSKL